MSDSFLMDCESLPRPEPAEGTVLVTGAGGRIGTSFAEYAHKRYPLTLMVQTREKADTVEAFGDVVVGDLKDLDRTKELLEGARTVVHLAARPSPDETWQPLLQDNIVGTYHLFVAAAAQRCRRVVFASSVHAVSGYWLDRQVQPDDPVSPGDLYGVTKCFGEAMGRFLATQHGLSCICVRIGTFQPRDKAREPDSLAMMNTFVSHRDLNQLLCRSIDAEGVRFAIVQGLSNNRFNRMNVGEARELLGYEPQDDFTELNARLRELALREKVRPHSDRHGGPSGIREEL